MYIRVRPFQRLGHSKKKFKFFYFFIYLIFTNFRSNGNLTMDASMSITESIPSTLTSYVFDQATALSNIQYSIAAYKGYLDAATPANAVLTVDTSKITTSGMSEFVFYSILKFNLKIQIKKLFNKFFQVWPLIFYTF